SVNDLRLTSSMLRTRVDQYARQRKIIHLCHEIEFKTTARYFSKMEPITFQLYIPTRNVGLFWRRLKLTQPDLAGRIRLAWKHECFKLPFDSLCE
ncbi:hypothetical protein PMAYCL1PPCAC_19818, partial [Pristionchus mayeri]